MPGQPPIPGPGSISSSAALQQLQAAKDGAERRVSQTAGSLLEEFKRLKGKNSDERGEPHSPELNRVIGRIKNEVQEIAYKAKNGQLDPFEAERQIKILAEGSASIIKVASRSLNEIDELEARKRRLPGDSWAREEAISQRQEELQRVIDRHAGDMGQATGEALEKEKKDKDFTIYPKGPNDNIKSDPISKNKPPRISEPVPKIPKPGDNIRTTTITVNPELWEKIKDEIPDIKSRPGTGGVIISLTPQQTILINQRLPGLLPGSRAVAPLTFGGGSSVGVDGQAPTVASAPAGVVKPDGVGPLDGIEDWLNQLGGTNISSINSAAVAQSANTVIMPDGGSSGGTSPSSGSSGAAASDSSSVTMQTDASTGSYRGLGQASGDASTANSNTGPLRTDASSGGYDGLGSRGGGAGSSGPLRTDASSGGYGVARTETPSVYTGGAGGAEWANQKAHSVVMADGSRRTITETGAVIRQKADGSSYREGWVDPKKIDSYSVGELKKLDKDDLRRGGTNPWSGRTIAGPGPLQTDASTGGYEGLGPQGGGGAQPAASTITPSGNAGPSPEELAAAAAMSGSDLSYMYGGYVPPTSSPSVTANGPTDLSKAPGSQVPPDKTLPVDTSLGFDPTQADKYHFRGTIDWL